MIFSPADQAALWLTFQLAFVVTVLLLMVGTPIAWWLANTNSRWKTPISAIVAMPIVLPPTVLGFYLLVFMGPDGPLGRLTTQLGLGSLSFTFTGLVFASVIYSLPFVVQPIQNAIEAVGQRPLEVAATLRSGPMDRFFTVLLPQARPGFLTATVLGFAHTVGEFGVVLMIGGNIPGVTQVVSVRIYDHVEALDYSSAQSLALTMIGFAFVVLLLLYTLNPRANLGRSLR